MTPQEAVRTTREENEAQEYAYRLRNADHIRPDWSAYNADIVARFSRTALLRIKTRAWQIVERGEFR